jgi:hypothetical protein
MSICFPIFVPHLTLPFANMIKYDFPRNSEEDNNKSNCQGGAGGLAAGYLARTALVAAILPGIATLLGSARTYQASKLLRAEETASPTQMLIKVSLGCFSRLLIYAALFPLECFRLKQLATQSDHGL